MWCTECPDGTQPLPAPATCTQDGQCPSGYQCPPAVNVCCVGAPPVTTPIPRESLHASPPLSSTLLFSNLRFLLPLWNWPDPASKNVGKQATTIHKVLAALWKQIKIACILFRRSSCLPTFMDAFPLPVREGLKLNSEAKLHFNY